MDEQREALVNECNILKFSADIAFKARQDEIYQFIKNIIREYGWDNVLNVKTSDSISPTLSPNRVLIEFDDSLYIYINFIILNYKIRTQLKITGIDYKIIYSNEFPDEHVESSNTYTLALRCMNVLSNHLNSLDKMLNNDAFNSYKEEIEKYLDASQAIKDYDDDVFKKIKDAMIKSFCKGMRLKYSSCKSPLEIIKVCPKRLYVDNYKPNSFEPCKKTILKDDVANLIIWNKWSIVS